ncbi:Fic family protein [Parathalassolituus penaei]|uniref:Fic family protein n=1 Tax=Parathalassolituus penaei TaxID=2997323 RepID=A0A9X3ECU7_9GAMM|nr:Fic family protein [Parathalassolituus penaei]MCY0964800.1 Fic family protein [Parathalassolituus penaei]
MKIPLAPPTFAGVASDSDLLMKIVTSQIGACDGKGRYLHWDKLRHLTPPEGFTVEEYWYCIYIARHKIFKKLPFVDKDGRPMQYCVPEPLWQKIVWISENATGAIEGDKTVKDEKTQKTYLIRSLIEEAINSSQLEGASTTRRVAKEMIRSGREPKDISERMILNNHMALKFISEMKNEEITPSMVFELHSILTRGTLDEGDSPGAFRKVEDDICVFDRNDDTKPVHIPPKASELPDRLSRLCSFINSVDKDGEYMHPIVKAAIAHFMIGYDHPFVDGNGRTARALFYWVMAKNDYWMMEYISISKILKESPGAYMKAYLYSEVGDNDLTYFIDFQLDVVVKAIQSLHSYLADKSRQIKETLLLLDRHEFKAKFNHRQIFLMRNALENPGQEYFIATHKSSHGVAYETARKDLLALSGSGLLKRYKSGNQDVFVAPPNLKELLSDV